MSDKILHSLSLSLLDDSAPEFPSYLNDYVQFTPKGHWRKTSELEIRGDFTGGAPTIEILDHLIKQAPVVASECWQFSLHENFENACAFQITLSSSGDERYVKLLNSTNDLLNPTAPPFLAALKPDVVADLSKRPQGAFSIIGNCLFVSDRYADLFEFSSSSNATVKGNGIEWLHVKPNLHEFLDRDLSFSTSVDNNSSTRLANIAKRNADLNFGLIADEGIGHGKIATVFLLSQQMAREIFPPKKRTLGDARLVPVYSHDSAEGEFMAAITRRMNTIISQDIAR